MVSQMEEMRKQKEMLWSLLREAKTIPIKEKEKEVTGRRSTSLTPGLSRVDLPPPGSKKIPSAPVQSSAAGEGKKRKKKKKKNRDGGQTGGIVDKGGVQGRPHPHPPRQTGRSLLGASGRSGSQRRFSEDHPGGPGDVG